MKGACKKLILVSMFLLTTAVANAQTIEVKSLYENRSLMPDALLPFRVMGSLMQSGSLQNVALSSSNGTDCRLMRDPFYSDLVLVKCLGETQLLFTVQVLNAGKVYQATYGPVNITNPAAGLIEVTPGVSGGSDPEWQAGKQLYIGSCVNCHNPPSTLRRRTVSEIQLKIQTVPAMSFLKSQLSASDLKKIETYLKDPR